MGAPARAQCRSYGGGHFSRREPIPLGPFAVDSDPDLFRPGFEACFHPIHPWEILHARANVFRQYGQNLGISPLDFYTHADPAASGPAGLKPNAGNILRQKVHDPFLNLIGRKRRFFRWLEIKGDLVAAAAAVAGSQCFDVEFIAYGFQNSLYLLEQVARIVHIVIARQFNRNAHFS